MTTTYHTEAHEWQYRDHIILIENKSPNYRGEEREAVKKAIEEQLYEIFCKYVSCET